ncbi:unnamed protein product [Alopecurus aequalis]
MGSRRSPRLQPQIQATEEGAGTAPRRSPRLHPQIHASQDGARRIRRRRRTSPAGPSFMPDDDDMLREILVRLPPEPSSLPRASAVCKRWLGIVTDPKFHHQFYARQRQPPILGFFDNNGYLEIEFNPILDPPDRIPSRRFSLGRYSRNNVLDCRHGRVLVGDYLWNVIVWDPITGEQRRLAIPPKLKDFFFSGAVLCADGNWGHVHGGCNSSPFKVVLVSTTKSGPLARVYSSETGEWGNLMSTLAPYQFSGDIGRTSTLVGNTLYWLYGQDQIIEFDLNGQGLSVIMGPPVTNDFCHGSRQIIKADDGAIGYAILSYSRFQTWQRNINGHGLATWVPWKTVEMDSILGLSPQIEGEMEGMKIIKGYEEDTDPFVDVMKLTRCTIRRMTVWFDALMC